VETSDVLQREQKSHLGAGISWHKDLSHALELTKGKAFLYHNELLDAFPATLLQWHEDEWQEVYLSDGCHEVWRPLPWDEAKRASFHGLQAWPTKHPRQRIEVHDSVRDWMQQWASAWKAGAMLTVDYGDEFPALYYRRPAGTLRAYLHQMRLEGQDVYRNPGRQDITADINFSDYRQWAQVLGWHETAYGTQADFIHRYVKNLPRDSAAKFILATEGAGGAFKHVVHRPASQRLLVL
jgi:SAM-dependent MidA family methyltransferase